MFLYILVQNFWGKNKKENCGLEKNKKIKKNILETVEGRQSMWFLCFNCFFHVDPHVFSLSLKTTGPSSCIYVCVCVCVGFNRHKYCIHVYIFTFNFLDEYPSLKIQYQSFTIFLLLFGHKMYITSTLAQIANRLSALETTPSYTSFFIHFYLF